MLKSNLFSVSHILEEIIFTFYRNAILTDNHLHVPNTEGVFAMGDCSTIELIRISDEVHHLFKLADKNKDGELSLDEFEGNFLQIFLPLILHQKRFSSHAHHSKNKSILVWPQVNILYTHLKLQLTTILAH